MNDKFFSKRNCDRCGKDLSGGRIMSMYNEDCICMECKDKETKRPDYKATAKEDIDRYLQGNKIIVTYGKKNDTKSK